MKKLITFLSSFFLVPIVPTVAIACEPIVSVPSKSYKGTTDEVNIFFGGKNTIKPYNLNYLQLINNSWEHYGFDSSLSSNKITEHLVTLDDNNSSFLSVLSEIYSPEIVNEIVYDFTGMTIVVENIFLNSIEVTIENENYQTIIQSDLALTIKKGWTEIGKILASLTNTNPLNKKETFPFINKIIMSLDSSLVISDSLVIDKETSEEYYEVTGYLSENEQTKLISDLITSASSKLSLDLRNKTSYDIDAKTMTIDSVVYKFVI